MAKSPQQYADLLNQALERVKKSGQKKESVKTEIAQTIGKSVNLIEHWQRGNCPATHSQAEIAAQILFSKRGLIDRKEFELFLDYAGHPSPATMWDRLFIKVDNPPADAFDIFVGREEKVEELANTLQLGRVVVLWGPGGVGKTSLVRAVIQKLALNNTLSKQFSDGMLYYDFYGPEHTADAALRYIARFFGVEVTTEISARDAASWALEGKQALIVLDGAEDADDLRKVWRIRRQCGLLIVSRYQHLDLSGKTIYLDLLSPDEAIAALRAWSTDEENQSHFQVWRNDSNEDEQNGHKICEELGRLPLALRLAGRYMLHRKVNPTKFLDLWREWRLALLRDGTHQHDSLQVLMEKSLEQVSQVSEDAREVMVVAGILSYQSFSTEVIAAGLEKSESVVEKLLQDLWMFSLIIRVSTERWQVVHRLIYTYAQSLEARGDLTTHLAAYYTMLVKEQSKLGQEGYSRLDKEQAHIMAVLTNCVGQGKWLTVHNLGWDIDMYLSMRGNVVDRITVCESGLKAARVLNDRELEEVWLSNLGLAYHSSGQYLKAATYHEEAMWIARQIGHRENEGRHLGNLGYAYHWWGSYRQAIWYYKQALAIAQEIGDRENEGNWLGNLGSAYKRQFEYDRAVEYYEQALAIARETGQRGNECGWLTSLSTMYGHLVSEKAIEYAQQALAIARETGHRGSEGSCLGNLGNVYFSLDQYQRAIEYYEQALAIAQEIGGYGNQLTWMGNLGDVYYAQEQYQRAIEYYEQAYDISWQLWDGRNKGIQTGKMGNVYYSLGEYDRSITFYEAALHWARQNRDRENEGIQLGNLGNVYYSLGQVEKAIEHYQPAAGIALEIGDMRTEGIWLGKLSIAYYDLGEYGKALECNAHASAIAQAFGNQSLETTLLSTLGSTFHALGDHQPAINAYRKALNLNPDDASIYNNLANVYLELKRVTEARPLYRRRIALHPEDALEAHVNLGIIARWQGNESEAQQQFEAALTVWDKALQNKVQKPFDILENKALAYLGLNQKGKALDTLKNALEQRQPNDVIHFVNLTFTRYDLLAETIDPPQGLAEMRRLLEEVVEAGGE